MSQNIGMTNTNRRELVRLAGAVWAAVEWGFDLK